MGGQDSDDIALNARETLSVSAYRADVKKQCDMLIGNTTQKWYFPTNGVVHTLAARPDPGPCRA
jgi:hypothetical protein